jgi:hypothetical protein
LTAKNVSRDQIGETTKRCKLLQYSQQHFGSDSCDTTPNRRSPLPPGRNRQHRCWWPRSRHRQITNPKNHRLPISWRNLEWQPSASNMNGIPYLDDLDLMVCLGGYLCCLDHCRHSDLDQLDGKILLVSKNPASRAQIVAGARHLFTSL